MPTPAAAAEARAIAGEVLNEEAQETSKVEEPAKAETPAKEPEVKPEPKPEPDEAKEEVKAERPERKSQYVPVSKANAWRHEAAEAKAKAAELERQVAELREAQEKAKASDIDAVAKEIAGEDASPEVVKRILEAAKKAATPEPNEDIKAVLSLKKQIEEQAEEAAFQKDLSTVLAKHPELRGHEESLREIAYAEGNERIPLDLLAYRLKEELNLTASPPSAEGKSSQAKSAPGPDFANMTDEQLEQLSDADMDKFIEWTREGFRKRTGVRLR
jgi:hypothetical protein